MKIKTIKKLLGFATIALLGGLILTGCGKSNADNSLKHIQNKNELVVGTSADYPPFEFQIVKNGHKQIVGYDLMVAQAVAKDMGVKLKVVNNAIC